MLRENELEGIVFLVGDTVPDDDAEHFDGVGMTEVFAPARRHPAHAPAANRSASFVFPATIRRSSASMRVSGVA